MYDELVKRLREAAEKSMCGDCGLNLHTGATKKGVLFDEAADAIEKLIKMPTPARPFFLSYNCEEKYERTDCAHYDEEQDMGAHIPFCKLYRWQKARSLTLT